MAVLPGLSLVGAFLLAVLLAPTDAGLGQAVVTNRSIPVRIRQAINVESGLNDGLATPLVLFAVAIEETEIGGSDGGWIGFMPADGVVHREGLHVRDYAWASGGMADAPALGAGAA